MTAEFINPALTVEAQFLGTLDGEARTSRFVLRQNPDIAAWLLTVVDFIRSRQGALEGERPIAAPPGGETLQRLIAGAVVLADRRPDGGLALRLNPGVEVALWLAVRRRGLPAQVATITLADDPALARWLLAYFLRDTPPPVPPPGAFADTLRRHGLLVTDLPLPEVTLPEGALAETAAVTGAAAEVAGGLADDLAADLATASRVCPQAAGEAVPVAVRDILGRHLPRLPPATGLWWLEDAGSGLVSPAPAGSSAPARCPGPFAAGRAASWDRQRLAARQDLTQRQYAVLREILAPGPRARLRRYVRQLVTHGYFPALGDGQVERRSAIHNEPAVASLHRGLARIVSDLCGEAVQASYCYLACYEEGAVLHRHKDRPQCNFNLSLVLDMQGPAGEPDPWPLYLELEGRAEPVLLAIGDGLVYSGTDLWHWREALPAGQRAIVCFFHFVPGDFAGSLD